MNQNHQTPAAMKKTNLFIKIPVAVWLLLALLTSVGATSAAIIPFNFTTTSLTSGAGPTAPGGINSISGTSLTAGDVVVLDCLVINTAGTISDNWGAVNLNQGGFLGITGATLGALVRTGNSTPSAVYVNGVGNNLTGSTAAITNRVRMELTCTTSGSTANMSYIVTLNQGFNGSSIYTKSGTGLTFSGNTIALTFGANATAEQFIQVLTPPSNVTAVTNATATFSVTPATGYTYTQQWYSNSVAIAGATSQSYTTPALTASANGAQYFIVVTNAFNSVVVTSTVATLTVRSGAGTVPIDFSTTTVSGNVGPVNPANGAVSIPGSYLLAGDTVVVDTIVANTAGTTGDCWGAVNLNGSGTGGVTGATLGVLVRTGVSSPSNPCALYTNGVPVSGNFVGTDEVRSNRVRIELYVATTGNTTNMGYKVRIDQGLTGTYTSTLSGTNLTLPNNTIPLSFGNRTSATSLFADNFVLITASASSARLVYGTNETATLTATLANAFTTTQQWLSNGVPISGATSLTYTTPALALGNSGDVYSVIVTNVFNTANVVTSTVPALTVRLPAIVPFNFADTSIATPLSQGAQANPNVSISGTNLVKGDTVVYDGIVFKNGATDPAAVDYWAAINLNGGGFGGVTSATLGILSRIGVGSSQLFINGSQNNANNPTSSGALTNRVRIELYVATSGTTTNVGWLVKVDQNLSGTFQPSITGTNLTFAGNNIALTYGAQQVTVLFTQNPQTNSIFSGPNPASQTVVVGSPVTVGVTVKGWNPTFQWRTNGVPVPGATSQNYTLATTTLADNGDTFDVIVSNALNSANVVTSGVATVTVRIPNDLTWDPADSTQTTWNTTLTNWTLDAGVTRVAFSSGDNSTFDSLGYTIGATNTVTNAITVNSVTVNANSSQAYVWAGSGSISGQSLLLTGDGTGSLGLKTTASFSSATIGAGTLNVGYQGTAGSFSASTITNNGLINLSNASGVVTIAGPITGSGAITKLGNGTLALTGTNNTFSIGSISAGTMVIASVPTGPITNNSELQPNSSINLTFPNVMSGTGHYNFTGFQDTTLTGVSTHTGQNLLFWSKVTVDNPSALGDTNTGSSVISGQDRIGGLYLSNNITWSQPLFLQPRQAGTTAPHVSNLSGTNSISNGLNFTSDGLSILTVEAATGVLNISSPTVNSSGTALSLNLVGAGTGVWSGALTNSSQSLGVVKSGTGTWTLNGTNTYTGATVITNGTLYVNGQIGNSAVSAFTGTTLGGTGIIFGATTVGAGAALTPGLGSIGTLSFSNNLTLNASSTNVFAVTANGASNSVVVAGTLTPNASVIKVISGAALPLGTNTLFTYGTNSGAFNPTPVLDVAAVHPATIVNDGAGHINLVVSNSAPVVSSFTLGAVSGVPATVQIIAGKYAPTDVDGDTFTLSAVGTPGNGTASSPDGTNIIYTADGDYTGTNTFTYTVTDSFGASSTATVTVTVTANGVGYNKLTNPVNLGDGTFRLSYLGIPGYNYALDWTASLTPPVTWTPQLTNTADTNGFLIYTNLQDTNAVNFWRTRYVP